MKMVLVLLVRCKVLVLLVIEMLEGLISDQVCFKVLQVYIQLHNRTASRLYHPLDSDRCSVACVRCMRLRARTMSKLLLLLLLYDIAPPDGVYTLQLTDNVSVAGDRGIRGAHLRPRRARRVPHDARGYE